MSAGARPKPLISVPEASRDYLKIGVTTGYEWLRRGEMPGAVRHGGRWYVRLAVLLAYINGADVPPSVEGGPLPLRHDAARHVGRAAGEER
jgi:hypothetical protein